MASPFNPVPLTVPKAPVQPFTAMEQWQEFFARLGMTRVLESQGPSVEEMTRRLCHRKGEETGEYLPQSLEAPVLFGYEGFPHSTLPVLVPVVKFIQPLPHGTRRGNGYAKLLKGQFLLQEGEVVRCASSREMEKDKGKDMFTVTESP